MSSPPFISRTDLGDRLNRDLSSDDAALACVDAACDVVRTLAEQNFNQVTEEIVLDGTGTDALLLPERPVSEVTEVVEGVDTLTTDDYKLNGNGILFRASPAVWSVGRRNVAVTYTHGYPDSDFPRDVRIVALNIAERLFTRGAGGISSETIGSYSVSYVTSQVASLLDNTEQLVIEKHRPRR